jgi:hypothetical protein
MLHVASANPMPPDIHILTPFSHTHLLGKLIEHLRPFGVHWHPILEPDCVPPWTFHNITEDLWIHPSKCPLREVDVYDICYAKLQHWLDTNPIDPNAYYVFMCDDNGYTPHFFDQLRQCTADVVFVSVLLGIAGVQLPSPLHLRVGTSGLRSYCVKGTVARRMRFRQDIHFADGAMAETLFATEGYTFRPDMIVLYNWFANDGRWADGTVK